MRYLRSALAFLFLFACIFCGGGEILPPVPEKPKEPQSVPEAEKNTEPYDYDLTEYITMGDITAVQAKFDDPSVCAEKEVDAAIFQILLSQAEFEEKAVGQRAERYNKVTVDLTVMQNGEVLADYGRTDYDVVIGLETEHGENTALGEALMGSAVGETRTAEYTYPQAVGGDGLSGQTVILSAVVKKVHRQIIPELIDATVGEISGDTFATVQEFRQAVRQDILAEKQRAKEQAVWLAVKKNAFVRRFPEEELQDYVATYTKYYEDLAAQYEVSLEQLVTVYMKSDMEAFAEDARAFAEEMVTNDMILVQLVRLQNITLSDEEYLAGARAYFALEESEFGSFEEFTEYYTEENLRRELLWDKALKAVVDRAVRIG